MKEERELQRPRQVVLLSFQNLVFPTSYFRLEGQGKVNEDLEIPTDRERRTEKKVKVRKNLANQSKGNFFSFPSLDARSRSVRVQATYSTSPVPTKSEAEHEANGEKERKPTTRRRNSRHKSHSLQVWSQVWWLGGKAPLVTPPPLHRRSRRS